MKIFYSVNDQGKCYVEDGYADFDNHFRQRMIGWLSQGWNIKIWPEED